MQNLERRALYNLIRMNWLNNPQLAVEKWQIEDYEELPTDTLLQRLEKQALLFDKQGFIAFSEDFDSPEDLTDNLVADRDLKPAAEDQIYLLIFELWRRLLPDQPTVSILCDFLDRQIFLYDEEPEKYEASCEKALTQFITLLKENSDQGLDPENVFERIANYFANDIETFLYDFITEKIENENSSYTEDLLESLDPYVSSRKWFVLLRFRSYGSLHTQIGRKLFDQIMHDHLNENDLPFNLELLSILSQSGKQPSFLTIAQQTVPLIKEEEDFQDFLDILNDYFQAINDSSHASVINSIKTGRKNRKMREMISSQDEGFAKIKLFLKALNP